MFTLLSMASFKEFQFIFVPQYLPGSHHSILTRPSNTLNTCHAFICYFHYFPTLECPPTLPPIVCPPRFFTCFLLSSFSFLSYLLPPSFPHFLCLCLSSFFPFFLQVVEAAPKASALSHIPRSLTAFYFEKGSC